MKVQGYDGLEIEASGAVVSTDMDGYTAFMKQYQSRMNDINRLSELEKKVEEQNDKLNLIISLLNNKKCNE